MSIAGAIKRNHQKRHLRPAAFAGFAFLFAFFLPTDAIPTVAPLGGWLQSVAFHSPRVDEELAHEAALREAEASARAKRFPQIKTFLQESFVQSSLDSGNLSTARIEIPVFDKTRPALLSKIAKLEKESYQEERRKLLMDRVLEFRLALYEVQSISAQFPKLLEQRKILSGLIKHQTRLIDEKIKLYDDAGEFYHQGFLVEQSIENARARLETLEAKLVYLGKTGSGHCFSLNSRDDPSVSSPKALIRHKASAESVPKRFVDESRRVLWRIGDLRPGEIDSRLKRAGMTDAKISPQFSAEIPIVTQQEFDRFKKEALANHPDIAKLELAVEQQSAKVTIAKREWLPEISAFSTYSRDPRFSRNENQVFAGVEVNWNLWDCGANRHGINREKALLEELKAKLSDEKRELIMKTDEAYRSYRAAHATWINQKDYIEFQKKIVKSANARFESGEMSEKENRVATLRFLEREIDCEKMKEDVLKKYAGLFHSLGLTEIKGAKPI